MVGFLQRKYCMKIQWYKQLICYTLIAILSVSGMQVEINNSHSYFACESSTSTETSQYHNTKSYISPDYCTNEQLQSGNIQYIKNTSAKRSIIRRARSFSPASTLCIIKQNLFYLADYYLSPIECSTSNQIVIIEYIHRQDGAK